MSTLARLPDNLYLRALGAAAYGWVVMGTYHF